jgi:hypothetical protein
MFVLRHRVAALIALAWPLASLASAQGTAGSGSTGNTGQVGVTPISIGPTTASTIGKIYLNSADCANNVPVLFQLDNLPQLNVDVYLGESCNTASNRSTTVSTACTFVKSVETNGKTTKFQITLDANQILPGCTANVQSVPKIWFLNVQTPHSAEEVGTNYALFDRLNIDTSPPSAPYNLTGGEGGSVISIGWKATDANIQGFVVFIDTTGKDASSSSPDASTPTDDSDGGASDSGTSTSSQDTAPRVSLTDGGATSNAACGPTLLVAGGDPLMLPGAVKRKKVNERTASGTDIVPSDLDGEKSATIAVSAVDLAGNQGPLSNLACIRIVQTTGFFERFKEQGGKVEAGCPCSAMGPARAEEAWPVGLAVLALGLSARRRKPW